MMSFDDERKKRDRRSSFVAPERAKARALFYTLVLIYILWSNTHKSLFSKKGEGKSPTPYKKKIPFKKEFRVYVLYFFLDEGRNYKAPPRASF